MTVRRLSLSTWVYGWVSWVAASAALPAFAQTTATPRSPPAAGSSSIQSLDKAQLEQERLKLLLMQQPPAYVDKVLTETQLDTANAAQSAAQTRPGEGVQTVLIETRLGVSQTQADSLQLRSTTELGVRTEIRREIRNLGELILQTDARQRSGENSAITNAASEKRRGQRLTLRSIELPLTPSVFLDTVVGHFSPEATDAFARGYRVSLPSSAVEGIGFKVYDNDWDLRLGFGERGQLVGGPYPGFERTQGNLSTAGLSRRWGKGGIVGLQSSYASNVPAVQDGNTSFANGGTENIESWAGTIGLGGDWNENGSWRLRSTYLRSTTQRTDLPSKPSTSAQGLFLEAGVRQGRYRHEMGLYAAELGLRSGDSSIPSDNQGGYWRVDVSGLRLSWGAGLDVEMINPKRDVQRVASTRVALSSNAQWRIDRNQSLGSTLSLAQTSYKPNPQFASYGDQASAFNVNLYYQTLLPQWGRSRLSFAARRTDASGGTFQGSAANAYDEVLWEHDWIIGRFENQRPEFTTSIGMARERNSTGAQSFPTAGLVFRHWIESDWSISGSLRYSLRTGVESVSKGLLGSAETEYSLGQGWSTGASLSLGTNQQRQNASLALAAQSSSSKDLLLFAYLRWSERTGTPFASTGQRNDASAGTGDVSGVVFYDADRDGLQQLQEAGVSGVEVLLDGRYRTTTDRNGRFSFLAVTTGRHQLSVRQDTVPLPWSASSQEAVKVDVQLRKSVNYSIPVTRISN